MRFKKNLININNKKFFYLDNNAAGEVIILLHGFPGNHLGLISLARNIGDNYRIIIPDLPACGDSDLLDTKHSLENYSDWVNDFLEALLINEVILVGHSFGSRIALVFSGYYPKKIKKLVLITPVLKVDGLLDIIVSTYYRIAKVLPEYLQKIMLSNGLGKRVGNAVIFKSGNSKIHREIVIRDIKEIKKLKPRVSMEVFDEFYKFSLIPEIKKISNNFLIIAGELDEVSPLPLVKELASQLSNAKLEIMKKCGHLVPLEKPKATASIIKKWLHYDK